MSYPIRPATLADSAAVAELLVQLYAYEAPGVILGAPERQRSLLRFMLERNDAADLQHRMVASNGSNSIIGTAATQLPSSPAPAQLSAATVRMALALLGYRSSLKIAKTLIFDLLALRVTVPPCPADALYVFSVAVDQQQRGRGVGQALLAACQAVARQNQLRTLHLRVVATNHQALAFYQRLGFQIVGRSPEVLDSIVIPTFVLQKPV
jgi:ribosomal protein S18 acetylase RimI-like enzyme